MSTIQFNPPTTSGTPDQEDIMIARWRVSLENARRAALDPPGTPLPMTPNAALFNSVLTVLQKANLQDSWADYGRQAAESVNQDFTQEQLAEIRANLKRRLQSGESPATIVADTAS